MDRGASAKPTLRQLRAFVAVAQSCNFTRAAEQLRLPQPLVSNLVRDLEAEVGFKLFDRTTRRVEVTEAAMEFFHDAQRLMREIDGVFSRANDVSGGRRGRLRVGAPPLLAAALLPQVIDAFHRSFPNVEFVLFDRSIATLQSQLRDGEISLAIGTFQHDDLLARIPLVADFLALLCPSDHHLAVAAEVPWSALTGARLVALRAGNGIRSQMDRGFAAAGLEVRPTFELDQLATIVAMVENGFGVAILPLYALKRSLIGSLVARPLVAPSIKREVELVHLRDRSLSPVAVEFTRLLKRGATLLQDEGLRILTRTTSDGEGRGTPS